MLKGKLGLASYLIILLFVGLIVSFFLFFILDGIYGKSHTDCLKANFEITDICKNGNSVQFSINNLGKDFLKISFDETIDSVNVIEKGSQGILSYTFKNDVVDITPYIRDSTKVYFCQGKKQSKNVRIVTKKC